MGCEKGLALGTPLFYFHRATQKHQPHILDAEIAEERSEPSSTVMSSGVVKEDRQAVPR
jgi:hypothetical protein